ncbi:MAG: ATP-binding cassette domain-containing protein [Rhizobiaceae bacterium]
MSAEHEPAAIHLDHVRFAWPEMPMEFDVSITPDRLVVVTGPSGSGKSTLLNLIAGFEPAAAGRIFIDGHDYTGSPVAERPVSMLFQDNNLFGHLNVLTNVGFGIAPKGRFDGGERDRIMQAIARVGLAGKEGRLPHQLSGGERQRAAFARVLLEDRPVLLLDEPFASLGPSLRREMMGLLKSVQNENPRTMLAVTHHPLEWQETADDFVFVDAGSVVAQGTLNQLDDARLPVAVRRYLGEDGD